MKRLLSIVATATATLITPAIQGAVITFDDAISGATTYAFDGDSDGIDDVIFSTTDPLGFNTAGPGPNMSYIDEPGLEGTSLLAQDLRVDFLNGALNALSFGFALSSSTEDDTMEFNVYNSAGNLIASQTVIGLYTSTPAGLSSFPEGQISVSFGDTAAYATFHATSDGGRHIIDNFTGTFGSTEVAPDAGSSAALLGLSIVGVAYIRRKVRA
jgi:hypothetical protein